MMTSLVERYIYDVARRLPEKEREDVSRELRSNIYDMLGENADESEIKSVLYQLGSPSSLAEKYRQKPRYLISPAIYDDYVRILKLVLPLVGGIVFAIGVILGAIDGVRADSASKLISDIILRGISMGVSGVFQALVWTTAAYAIVERVGVKTGKLHEWKIEDLPEPLPASKGLIPLSDSITDLILTVVFCTAAILACSGAFPLILIPQGGNAHIINPFSTGFLQSCIPFVAIISLLGIAECIVKLKTRRWTPFVCGTVIIDSIVSAGIIIYCITRPNLFSEEFIAFVKSNEWSGLLRLSNVTGVNVIAMFFLALIVICTLAECGGAVYKTIKYAN